MYAHEEIAEAVAGQNAHKRVQPEALLITDLPVALHVADEYTRSQDEEKGFETKEGDEDVHKVSVDTRERAEILAGNKVVDC